MALRLTDSRLANLGATSIHTGFGAYRSAFGEITERAQVRFEARDWHALHRDMVERLNLYGTQVTETVAAIRELLAERVTDKMIWASMKAVYSGVIAGQDHWELAETFFNSVTRKIFSTVGLDPRIEFVDTDFETPPIPAEQPIYRTYHGHRQAEGLLKAILQDYAFETPYQDAEADAARVAEALDGHLRAAGALPLIERAEMLRAVFYRGKRAYLVGRVFSGLHVVPLVLALVHDDNGGAPELRVDAALLHENDVSILFSFTRSYFHVALERPHDTVRFLRSLMPRKRLAELYNSIGWNKHGKTELYRDILRHLATSDQQFLIAPGIRGMVMIAFTMPGYDLIFKVIKDRFPQPKTTNREIIRSKYELVFTRDRAGRLVEAQEFEHLQFALDRFAPELIEELVDEAGDTIKVEGNTVVVKHAYVERRVIPLNLYINQAEPRAARDAIIDYGHAIKDLLHTNIFPGDMLTKNFGVTRHGRVVFYDYDEITLATECRFRTMPQARSYEDELSAEPWFSVAENDVFPEELRVFLGLQGEIKEAFEAHHADLYDAAYWSGVQDRITQGEVIDIVPYMPERRV